MSSSHHTYIYALGAAGDTGHHDAMKVGLSSISGERQKENPHHKLNVLCTYSTSCRVSNISSQARAQDMGGTQDVADTGRMPLGCTAFPQSADDGVCRVSVKHPLVVPSSPWVR